MLAQGFVRASCTYVVSWICWTNSRQLQFIIFAVAGFKPASLLTNVEPLPSLEPAMERTMDCLLECYNFLIPSSFAGTFIPPIGGCDHGRFSGCAISHIHIGKRFQLPDFNMDWLGITLLLPLQAYALLSCRLIVGVFDGYWCSLRYLFFSRLFAKQPKALERQWVFVAQTSPLTRARKHYLSSQDNERPRIVRWPYVAENDSISSLDQRWRAAFLLQNKSLSYEQKPLSTRFKSGK